MAWPFLTAAQREARAPEQAPAEPSDVAAPRALDPFAGIIPGYYDTHIERHQAMTVPAFRRAVQVIAGSLGQLKLAQLDSANKNVVPIPFLRQPDPKRTTQVIISQTIEDLCLWGAAYWYNPRWATADGWRFSGSSTPKHKSVERIAPEDVALVRHDGYTIYRYDSKGVQHPVKVPLEAIIMFEAPSGHWLRDGSRTLQTAQLLEDAVRTYAKTPLPQVVIQNAGPRKTPQQVQELLSSYEASRSQRSTAYTGRDLSITSLGFDAQQIALSEARAQVVLDIARMTGVPSLYLSQGIQNSSHSYSNLTQQRLDLWAAMQPFAHAIEQRLSFDDVTGQGYTVAFDMSSFLRVDPMYRADLYAKAITSGWMTVEEVRAFEQLEPTPNAPGPGDPDGGIEGPNRTGTTS